MLDGRLLKDPSLLREDDLDCQPGYSDRPILPARELERSGWAGTYQLRW